MAPSLLTIHDITFGGITADLSFSYSESLLKGKRILPDGQTVPVEIVYSYVKSLFP
jgi:hypothetical protein